MCRSTAAPLMAMAGMAGTMVGVAFAVIRERVDRRAIQREADEAEAKERAAGELDEPGEEKSGSSGQVS